MDAEREKGIALVRGAIKASGLSLNRWAKQEAKREPRTVRRWVSGESPVPSAVIEWLKRQSTDKPFGYWETY